MSIHADQRTNNGGANQSIGAATVPAGGAADTSGMTAAQIAKIEAKRAAKAAKAAAKGAAKKEKKKAAGLGVGCAELRQRILPSVAPLLELNELSRKIDPFLTGDVSVLGRPPVAQVFALMPRKSP